MTKRAQLKEHINILGEIGSIMTAMKNLSLIEINKLTKYISTQEKVMETIKNVGKDFLHCYPDYYAYMQADTAAIYILIGSERGFCGKFNDSIINAVAAMQKTQFKQNQKFIIVGHKLAAKMVDDNRIIQVINAPNSAEEIPDIIFNLTKSLEEISTKMKMKLHPGYWTVIFNKEDNNTMETVTLQPFFEFKKKINLTFTVLPVLNLAPANFLPEFINQYLISTLYFVFYESFVSEQYQRMHHLDNALDRLEKKVSTLYRHFNLLRQEEITQEIQIIMLSAEAILEETQKK